MISRIELSNYISDKLRNTENKTLRLICVGLTTLTFSLPVIEMFPNLTAHAETGAHVMPVPNVYPDATPTFVPPETTIPTKTATETPTPTSTPTTSPEILALNQEFQLEGGLSESARQSMVSSLGIIRVAETAKFAEDHPAAANDILYNQAFLDRFQTAIITQLLRRNNSKMKNLAFTDVEANPAKYIEMLKGIKIDLHTLKAFNTDTAAHTLPTQKVDVSDLLKKGIVIVRMDKSLEGPPKWVDFATNTWDAGVLGDNGEMIYMDFGDPTTDQPETDQDKQFYKGMLKDTVNTGHWNEAQNAVDGIVYWLKIPWPKKEDYEEAELFTYLFQDQLDPTFAQQWLAKLKK